LRESTEIQAEEIAVSTWWNSRRLIVLILGHQAGISQLEVFE
jgi:hypothetical protein